LKLKFYSYQGNFCAILGVGCGAGFGAAVGAGAGAGAEG
jgi:hypothetical protein